MSGEQYLRKVSLIVLPKDGSPGVDLSELRLRFEVRRGDVQTPNSLDVRIYNLDDQTANNLQLWEYATVILSAGYQKGNFGRIFIGQLTQVRIGRESAVDTVVDLTVADGDYAHNWTFMNQSIAAGATQQQAWNIVAQAMINASNGTVKMGRTATLGGPPMPRGQVFFGPARDYARDMARTAAANWSIQDGAITLTGLSELPGPQLPISLSPENGLIGVPQQLINGFHFRVLLNPNIGCQSIVNVNSRLIQKMRIPLDLSSEGRNTLIPTTAANGNYRVIYVEHTGDTRGQEWYTDMICLNVDSNIVPPSLVPKLPGDAPQGPVRPYG